MRKKSGCLISQTFEDDILTLPFTNTVYHLTLDNRNNYPHITTMGKTKENHRN